MKKVINARIIVKPDAIVKFLALEGYLFKISQLLMNNRW
jgi:hypothetical protein